MPVQVPGLGLEIFFRNINYFSQILSVIRFLLGLPRPQPSASPNVKFSVHVSDTSG